MNTFAILIDAGFVKTRLGSADNPTTAEDIRALVQRICKHPTLAGQSLYRVYFYDAPPFAKTRLAPLNGGQRAFAQEPLTKHNLRLHQELKKMDYFALRMGEVRFRGWEIAANLPADADTHNITAADLRPSLQQKGVDMRIGLDIASLTLKKQVATLVLVTGDSDFVPPMKFARREGVQFALVTLGHKVHADLLEHSDFSLEITL